MLHLMMHLVLAHVALHRLHWFLALSQTAPVKQSYKVSHLDDTHR